MIAIKPVFSNKKLLLGNLFWITWIKQKVHDKKLCENIELNLDYILCTSIEHTKFLLILDMIILH